MAFWSWHSGHGSVCCIKLIIINWLSRIKITGCIFSKHRHSKLFRSRSAENLDNKERDIEDDESFTAKRSKLEEKTQTEDEKPGWAKHVM